MVFIKTKEVQTAQSIVLIKSNSSMTKIKSNVCVTIRNGQYTIISKHITQVTTVRSLND